MRLLIAFLILIAAPACAQLQCQFYLANQFSANQGFALHLEAPADSKGACSLNSLSLVLTVGDGAGYHHTTATPAWQMGVVYVAKAVITASGPQQLALNGQPLGSTQAAFKPAQGTLEGSQIGSTQGADPAYVVTQIALQASNGSNTVSIAPYGSDPTPMPLVLMAGGGTLWPSSFIEDPAQATTVTATFRFDAAVSNPHQFDPYVNMYGQTTFGTWPSKAKADSDLQAAIGEEQAWLADNGPPGGTDIYGGSTSAGWKDKATNYYHTVFRNNRWWLISPLGNPLFYIGLTGIYEDSTPITGRENMFAGLPAAAAGEFAPAYAQNVYGDTQNTTYFSFATANLIRKYGSGWKDTKNAITLQRVSSWGFAGSGKWTHLGPGLTVPLNPVLRHDGVPNIVPGGHLDVFDSSTVSLLKSTLAQQIGSNATNPYIIGWSVGNEKDEIVGTAEVQAILALGASVPVKKALVDQVLTAIYSGSLSALAAAWKITASTVADIYAAKPTPPSKDLETLRQYYEQNYYATLYKTVKSIDPNHLYLGSWILPRDYPTDWLIAAANCDVIGIDLYSPTFLEPEVTALIGGSNKPVLIGEFSYPSAYGGKRGFGSAKYSGVITLSDSASGDLYTQWLRDTSLNAYVVGVEWFDYRDEPLSGRGNNNGVGNISSDLVIGENFAFGMVDIADRPKYDLVNKVRVANLAALQSLGLLAVQTPPAISLVANAEGESPTIAPNTWVEIKGATLAPAGDTRIWLGSDFVGSQMPTQLDKVSATVNGKKAYVYYISPTQVNILTPPDAMSGPVQVVVTNSGAASASFTAQAQALSLSLFVFGGGPYVAARHADFSLLGPASLFPGSISPAKPGETILLYANGFGQTPTPVVSGSLVQSGTLTTLPVVKIGGTTAMVRFAGLVSPGEFQFNVVVPPETPDGDQPISATYNSSSTQPGTLITVQH